MKKKWRILTAVLLIFSLVLPVQAAQEQFRLTEDSRIYVNYSEEPAGELLQTAQLIQRQLGACFGSLPLVWGTEKAVRAGDLVLELTEGLKGDGFCLDVGKTARISGNADGLLRGASYLMKGLREDGSLDCRSRREEPDTPDRIVHLDAARKYYSAAWIENFIRQISWMGYNALELHLSEDGGFRGDFWDETWYQGEFQPENDFSWLCGSRVQYWVHGKYRQDPDAGKYLTTEELVRICRTAREYHVQIIPSFDSPAHMDYLTRRFEEELGNFSFRWQGKEYHPAQGIAAYNRSGASRWSAMDITDETARAFVFSIYADMADFFRTYAGSTCFHIGGDEVSLRGARWSFADFPDYVNSLNRMLNDRGYTCRMYNDFIGTTGSRNEDFDSNIEIVYWNSDYNPNSGTYAGKLWSAEDFWSRGRTVYNGIQTGTYYALRVAGSGPYENMDARNPENLNWLFYRATEEGIYREWKPELIRSTGLAGAEKVTPVPEELLGGGYFMIWCDYAALNTEEEIWEGAPDDHLDGVFYSLFDRMWSNICKMWDWDLDEKLDFQEFQTIRDSYGYFPGYAGCQAEPDLPQAVPVIRAGNPVPSILPDKVSLICGNLVLETHAFLPGRKTVYLPARPGFHYVRAEGGSLVLLTSGDGSAFLTVEHPGTIRVWMEKKE